MINQTSADAIMMQQMMGLLFGGGRVWLEAVFLLGLFAAALFQRHHIHNIALFRRSYYLFGLSILVPPCLVLLVGYATTVAGGSSGSSGQALLSANNGLLNPIILASGPVLFAISVICALSALVPPFIPPPDLPPASSKFEASRR